jgi:hypothetical protein
VARELERLRIAGVIGAPLDAQLQVWCTPNSIDGCRVWVRNCDSS